MAKDINVLDDFVEEKLLHTHTSYLAKVVKITSPTNIDVQPLTKTKQYGKAAKAQAVITGICCLDQCFNYITTGTLVLCVACERDITEAIKGNSAVPSVGRHQMKDSLIVGTIGGQDQSAVGSGATTGAVYDNSKVQKMFDYAEKYIGMKYTFGGCAPKSFDCSGFVQWVLKGQGINVERTAQGIYNGVRHISAGEARAGDLIFFTRTYNAGRAVTHIGLYAGNGRMLHCGDPIQYTSCTSSYWQSHLYGYGRVFN